MTDYEINKRLAEIAGRSVLETPNTIQVDDGGPPGAGEWNPLNDWSQLGPMMERFHVQPEYDYDAELWDALVDPRDCVCPRTERGMWGWVYERHYDVKRAICLAIIAAHDEGDAA